MTTDAPYVTVPEAPKAEGRHPAVIAFLWGNAGVLAGVALVLLLALPSRPGPEADGWDELGWMFVTLAAAAVAGIVGGAIGTFWGLRRNGLPYSAATAVVYVPTAALCGAVTVGLGALAAPAVAWWLVDGFRGARFKSRAPLGYGPPETLAASAVSRRRRGLAQRLVVTVVVCVGATAWILNHYGYELGGEVHGELLVWGMCIPALVVVPVVLLRRHLPPLYLVGGIVLAVVAAGSVVPSAVAGAHPSAERLERLALDLPVPPGQQVAEHHNALVARPPVTEIQPITILVSVPNGSVPPHLPPAFTPLADGTLPHAWSRENQSDAPAPCHRSGTPCC